MEAEQGNTQDKIPQYHIESEPQTLEEAIGVIKILTEHIKTLRKDLREPVEPAEQEEPLEWPETLSDAITTIFQARSIIEGLAKVIEANRYDDLLKNMLKRSEIVRNIEQRIQVGEKFGIIVIDLDNFKQVNDEFLHEMGNKVLKTFAQLLQEKFRRQGEVEFNLMGNDDLASATGRLGGDEMVITFNLFDVDDGSGKDQNRTASPAEQMEAAQKKIREIEIELLDIYPQLKAVGFGISFGGVAFDRSMPVKAIDLLEQADVLAEKDKSDREYEWFCALPVDQQDKILVAYDAAEETDISNRRLPKTFAAIRRHRKDL